MHLPLDGPLTPSEPQGFTPEQMIPCDECLRVNPPTRLSCLYCEAPLPLTESSVHLRKLTLRQPEKHEIGFNCILLTVNSSRADNEVVTKAAELLKLKLENIETIINVGVPMPLARTSNLAEAELVRSRLGELNFDTIVLSDEDLGTQDELLLRPRSMQIQNDYFVLRQPGDKNQVEVSWTDLCLIVSGRLIMKKVEIKERLSRRSENEILDTSEFFSDEAVFDVYSTADERTWRIGANSFDFSCLQEHKSFVASENLDKLRELISVKCRALDNDNSYKELKTALEFVWPVDQETRSRGWRRERPGKFSLEAANINSNESQFTRYSRMRRYFALKKRIDESA